MDEPGFLVLTVKRAGAQAAIAGRAHHQGHSAAPTVMGGGGELHDAVHGTADEVGKLQLHDGAQAHQRHARRHAGEAQLGERGVHDSAGAELGLEAARHLERAAELTADVLAQQQHIRVAAHLLAQRFADRGKVGQGPAVLWLLRHVSSKYPSPRRDRAQTAGRPFSRGVHALVQRRGIGPGAGFGEGDGVVDLAGAALLDRVKLGLGGDAVRQQASAHSRARDRRASHSASSSGGTYSAPSWMAWPSMRMVLASIRVGPPPVRARSTASRTTA